MDVSGFFGIKQEDFCFKQILELLTTGISLIAWLRCMITSGPRSAASKATSVQPNAFDVAPNALRLLGKSFAFGVISFYSIANFLSLRLLKAGKNKKEANIYIQNARRQITFDTAARAWARVP